jgi:alpha-L-fucosidase
MRSTEFSRRTWLRALAGSVVTSAAASAGAFGAQEGAKSGVRAPAETPPDHERRMEWWRDAKFGMFIHWGLYSQLGRGEWVLAVEDIPLAEYEPLAKSFNPRPKAAREWARLAREAGMKYMVMTAKHHEGFCLFDTKTTDYCATRQGPGRDLVREYLDAVRSEGLRAGLYYSLMDWHHPDWLKCRTDPAARRRMDDFAHAQVRELMTNYGRIDILWYDMAYPLDGAGWESRQLNERVLEWQPDIVINNRSGVPGDFSTPEQTTQATRGDWESCMTLNDNWGYTPNDDNWKSPATVLRNLVKCCQDGGNYLLNIGPPPDGSVPGPTVRILQSVGDWMSRNGSAIYGSRKSWVNIASGALFTRKDNTIYVHITCWPGTSFTIGGIDEQPKGARLLASGKAVDAVVRGSQLVLSGLPSQAPDQPFTVIAVDFDSAPVQDSLANRIIYDVLGGGPDA